MKRILMWAYPKWFINEELINSRDNYKSLSRQRYYEIQQLEQIKRELYSQNQQFKMQDAARKVSHEVLSGENMALRERIRVLVNGDIPKSAYEYENELKEFITSILCNVYSATDVVTIMNDWDTIMDAKSVLSRLKNVVK